MTGSLLVYCFLAAMLGIVVWCTSDVGAEVNDAGVLRS
jgi:hypothetical protein